MVGTDANGQVQVVIPTITIASGDTLTLNVSAPGHPLYIKTTNSTGTGTQATGATGLFSKRCCGLGYHRYCRRNLSL